MLLGIKNAKRFLKNGIYKQILKLGKLIQY